MGQEVGNAFISVSPKLSDDFGSKLSSKGTPDGASYGNKFSTAAGNALDKFSVMAGNLLSDAIEAVASKVGETFVDMFEGYADYEQLVGGVDTLFKESSATVQAYAANAYKTAGMSANEYMEQVTSFSASLLQGLGGDTEAAAKYADMAMSDMSDNANKMGTDMGLITNAYQGFAKQNYTMLDNLKLGYGGTKTEMERLLADASKIAGVEFDIDNYDDVIEAIHVMQVEMGIAGTTAEEAEHTISGSLGMMRASWDNLLAGILNENADIGMLFEQFLSSVGAVASNLAPRFAVLFVRIFQQLPQAIVDTIMSLPSTLEPVFQAVFGEYFGTAITDNLNSTFEFVFTAVNELMQGVTDAVMPVVNDILALIQSVMPNIMQIIGSALTFIGNIVRTVWTAVSSIITGAMTTISAIIQNLWPQIESIVTNAVTKIQSIMQYVWPAIQSLVTSVMNAIDSVMQVAWPIIQDVVSTVMSAILGIIETVWPAISGIVEGAVITISAAIHGLSALIGIVTGIFNAVKEAITHPIETAQSIVQGAIDTIQSIINGAHLELPHFALPHFNIYGGELPWGIGGMGTAPSISVDWYASGGFVDGATLIGAGEKGAEMILPQSGGLMDDFSDAVSAKVDSQAVVDELRRFERMIGPIISDYAPSMTRREFNRAARTAVAYG